MSCSEFFSRTQRCMKNLSIFTDGGARGNPGPAAIGVVIKTEHDTTLATLSEPIGVATNNVAEYTAVIRALEWLKKSKQTIGSESFGIRFFLDSLLVVNQLNGFFKVKDENLRMLFLRIRILESEVGTPPVYTYISREKNFDADALVNDALDRK